MNLQKPDTNTDSPLLHIMIKYIACSGTQLSEQLPHLDAIEPTKP